MKLSKADDDDFVIENIYSPLLQGKYLYADYCPTREPFQVYIAEDALRDIYQHSIKGLKEAQGEIAGALLGNVYQATGTDIVFVEINAAIQTHTRSSRASVEIPEEEWFRVSTLVERDTRYRNRCTVVGWYHSHPGFGIFMSGTDHHTQRSHFSLQWQVAIVIDPTKLEIGCFVGKEARECPLYKLPSPSERALVTGRDLLQNIAHGPTALSSTSDTLTTQLLQIRAVLEQLKLQYGSFDAQLEEKTRASSAQLNEISNILQGIRQEIATRPSDPLPEIRDLRSLTQTVQKDIVVFRQSIEPTLQALPRVDPRAYDNIQNLIQQIIKYLQEAETHQNRLEGKIEADIRAWQDQQKVVANLTERLANVIQNRFNQAETIHREHHMQASEGLSVRIDQLATGLPPKFEQDGGKTRALIGQQQVSIHELSIKLDIVLKQLETIMHEATCQAIIDRFWAQYRLKITLGGLVFLILSFFTGLLGAYLYTNLIK